MKKQLEDLKADLERQAEQAKAAAKRAWDGKFWESHGNAIGKESGLRYAIMGIDKILKSNVGS